MEELQFDEIDEIASQLLSQAQERSPSRELGGVVEPGEMEVVPAPDDGEEEEEEEEAEEIRSRDRGDGDEDDYEEEEEAPEPVPEPAPRRQRGKPNKSPATQKQPAQKPRKRASQKQKPEKPRPTAPPKPRRTSGARRKSDEGSVEDGGEGENAIEVTVQRFVNFRKRRRDDDEEADDIDPLQLDIPFANSSRENAVDVFAQVCEEVIGNTLSQFEQHAQNAPDAAKKKEFRIKIRAVEAYREVLKSRLLQHAIHLNHWHSLRKRVRQTQKEKLALREEILRIKGEREQVALRMDAVRAKYEADNKEATFLLNTSSTMYDIDMAVSKGQDAPQLSGKAQKEAELSNLEFLVAQLTDQVSSSSESGGNLHQVQDFNAFLERAAQALESR
uniref:Inner kinetochore subunit AME1 domain-containing protein n=1 Tax=Bionectria ochroleuca TaxID=29856 RepID=A0A0B7JPK0_BIOOC